MIKIARKRARLIIKGRVQGVFFRQSMKKEADFHGVSGWVRNLVSGEVEAVIKGDGAAVDSVIEWCKTGPDSAHVEHLAVELLDPVDETGPFVVKS